MNFLQILSDIEQVDPEVYERLDSRRAVFKNLSGLGQKLTAAALPLAVGAIFNKAYAQTPVGASVTNVLNFALKLEYLESYFYNARTTVTGLSAVNSNALALIATDEANHVTFLRGVLGSNAIPVPSVATFDYTAKGAFPTVLTNADTYLAVAQSFEDLGVRAYKGAAPLVMSNKAVLTAALSIHAVEARHASHIRAMRRAGPSSSTPSQGTPIVSSPNTAPKSWVSGLDGGGAVPRYTSAIYGAGSDTNAPAGLNFLAEDNTTQGGINLHSLPNTSTFSATAFSEAFDEGLDVGTVARIANLFSVSGNYFG
ncbi:MAG: ferritin-like domain-containing protein [Hymenobacter sp.]|nr:MAG: ferritin-like domain-containing protein [Hymenobacter sp.]